MNVYVASSWRNAHQQSVVAALRKEGHQVYDFRNPEDGNNGFSWRDIDQDWKGWSLNKYRESLSHPVAEHGFHLDRNAMVWCDACVLVMPCGRSAHLELGWAIGAGRFTAILILDQCEPELMYKLADKVCLSLEELIEWLASKNAYAS